MGAEFKLTEQNYRYLFENASDAMWVQDMEGNIVDANVACEKLTGFSREELLGKNVKEFLSGEFLNLARGMRRKLLNGEGVTQSYEQRLMRKDRTIRTMKIATSLVIIDGEPIGFQHVARDVTEEKSIAEMLSKITNGSPVPTFVINKQHKITHWNTAIESLAGLRSQEMIGTDKQWQAFYPEKRPTMADLIVDGASADEIEVYYRGKSKKSDLIDGAYEAEDFFPALSECGKWLHFTASPIKNEDGGIIAAIETLEDITERKRVEENLHYYLQEITRAQEGERKRIARELHDDTAQVLGSLSRQLDNFIRKKHGLAPNEVLFLKDLQAQLNRGVKGVHRFVQDLRPPLLDDLGLIPALRSLARALQESDGIATHLNVLGEERRFSPEVELLLFRIIQEAFNNIRRHAQASEAQVAVEFAEDRTKVTIRDNGRGFELSGRIDDLPRSGKLGLAGIQERVRLLGGTIEVQSTPGKGTTLIIEVPG